MSLQTTGFNSKTAENLLLDAGAIYKNLNETTFEGTLIGATQGGSTFAAIPNMRNIPVDGVKGEDIVGLTVVDFWKVTLSTAFLEISADTIKMALGASSIKSHDDVYDAITGKNYIADIDYFDNIAYVGKISGSARPVVIIIYKALNKDGMTLAVADSSEGKLPVVLTGNMDAGSVDAPPFKILYPKNILNTASVANGTYDLKTTATVPVFTITSSSDAICEGVKVDGLALDATAYTIGVDGLTVTLNEVYAKDLIIGQYEVTLMMTAGNHITEVLTVVNTTE